MEKYNNVATVPQNAMRTIEGGNLKGKSEVNPQWRIEALTREYGMCGIGWKFEITEIKDYPCADGQVLLFMRVNLYIKDGAKWSSPIPGCGGDFIIEKNRHGLVPNDEAYKMALTDALGNAAKCVGVAADVYRGFYDSKNGRRDNRAETAQPPAQQTPPANQNATNQAAAKQPDVATIKNTTCILANGKYYPIEPMNLEQLNRVINEPRYKAAHDEARKLMMELSQQQ